MKKDKDDKDDKDKKKRELFIKKVRKIEDKISKLCREMSESLELDIGWSDAREFAAGATLEKKAQEEQNKL